MNGAMFYGYEVAVRCRCDYAVIEESGDKLVVIYYFTSIPQVSIALLELFNLRCCKS